jgi:hypothetical protein
MATRSCGTGQGRPVPDLLGPDGQPLATATVGGRTVYIENHGNGGNGHQPAEPAPTAPPVQAPVWERRDPPADRYVHHDPVGRVQAQAAEEPVATGVVEGGAVRLPFGRAEDARTFRLAPDLNTLPFLRFATAANDGGRTEDLEGLARGVATHWLDRQPRRRGRGKSRPRRPRRRPSTWTRTTT